MEDGGVDTTVIDSWQHKIEIVWVKKFLSFSILSYLYRTNQKSECARPYYCLGLLTRHSAVGWNPLSICTGYFQFSSLKYVSSLINWIFFPVWNIKLAKSKIPVRVVKNVISKWTKMEFPRFPFLWFTAVGVLNPPDQKLVMYISLNCKKGINS